MRFHRQLEAKCIHKFQYTNMQADLCIPILNKTTELNTCAPYKNLIRPRSKIRLGDYEIT